jgi:heat shock protein HslJ
MRRSRFVSTVVCGASWLLITCPHAEPAASLAESPSGPPTLTELQNATYTGLKGPGGTFTLKHGRWEGEPHTPGAAARPSVSLVAGFRVTGDLDGDGAEEAVVVLAESSGGSGTFDYLAVVKRTASGIENVATAALGDRVQIRSARVDNGMLLVSVVRAGKDDPMCCPGELAGLGWTLAGSRLESVALSAPTGRLSLDTLAGTEWVLRAWDFNETAPDEPEVTLSYKDGRFAGSSGCNRYSGAATAGDPAVDFSMGTIMGTRTACPEPQSSVERRFLKQLGSAKKFSFLLGRLAVTYEREGGALGTMLFDGRAPAAASKP